MEKRKLFLSIFLLFLICFDSTTSLSLFQDNKCIRNVEKDFNQLINGDSSIKPNDKILSSPIIKSHCALLELFPHSALLKKLPLFQNPAVKFITEKFSKSPKSVEMYLYFSGIAPWYVLYQLAKSKNLHQIPKVNKFFDETTQLLALEGFTTTAPQKVPRKLVNNFITQLLPFGDPPIEDENPSFASCYTPYVMSYVLGWVFWGEFMTQTYIAMASKNAVGETTIHRGFIAGVFFVVFQYIYSFSMLLFSKGGAGVCQYPRMTLPMIGGHIGLVVIGVIFGDTPAEWKPLIKAYKTKVALESNGKEASDTDVVRIGDDIRTAMSLYPFPIIGFLIGLLELALAKSVSRFGLILTLLHTVMLTSVCSTSDVVEDKKTV